MKLETFLLPDFWACTLINGDSSGLSDSDEKALDAWFDATFPDGAHCVDCGAEPEFARYHDASNHVLACDCLTYTFDVGAPS